MRSPWVPNLLIVAGIDQVRPGQGELARELPAVFSDSDHAEVRSWRSAAVAVYGGNHAQIDPFMASVIVTGLFSAMVLVAKIHTNRDGKARLQKLHKGDVAAIAGIAVAMFGTLVGS